MPKEPTPDGKKLSRWDQKPYPYIDGTDTHALVWGLQAAKDMKAGWHPMQQQDHLNGMMPAMAAFSEWWKFSLPHLSWAFDDFVSKIKSDFAEKHGHDPSSRQLLTNLLFISLHHIPRDEPWFALPIPRELAREVLEGLSFLAGGEAPPIFTPAKRHGTASGAPVSKYRQRADAVRTVYLLRGAGLLRHEAIKLLSLHVTAAELTKRWEPDVRKAYRGQRFPKQVAVAEGFDWVRQYWFVEGAKLSDKTLSETLLAGRKARIGSAQSIEKLWYGTVVSRHSKALYSRIAERLAAKPRHG